MPSEEEVRSMLTPEQVCAYYSTLVAEQRLKVSLSLLPRGCFMGARLSV